VLQWNQYAARTHRHDFIAQVLRVTYDFFVENVNAQREITELADYDAHNVEQKFIEENEHEYDFPVFDFYVNAPDLE
jgi:hypothetical protein